MEEHKGYKKKSHDERDDARKATNCKMLVEQKEKKKITIG